MMIVTASGVFHTDEIVEYEIELTAAPDAPHLEGATHQLIVSCFGYPMWRAQAIMTDDQAKEWVQKAIEKIKVPKPFGSNAYLMEGILWLSGMAHQLRCQAVHVPFFIG